MINGHEDSEAMRQECLTKLLLKITVPFRAFHQLVKPCRYTGGDLSGHVSL